MVVVVVPCGADQQWCAELRSFLKWQVMWCVWKGCGKKCGKLVGLWGVVM